MRTFLLIIALVSSACAAQSVDDEALARVKFSLRSGGTLATETDVDGGGTVSIARLGPTLSARYAQSRTWFVDVRIGAEFSFYDFADATAVVAGGDPAGDFAEYFLSARYTGRINDAWWWYGEGEASWASEDSENLGDGFVGRGELGALYTVRDGLQLGVVIVVRSRLEDDAIAYPLPILHWQLDDRWLLATGDDGLRLSYAAWEDWTLFASLDWETREYRLRETGPIPGGVLRDDRIPVVLGAQWHPAEHFELEAVVGAMAWSRYDFLDATGTTIADPDGDASLMAGFSARIRF